MLALNHGFVNAMIPLNGLHTVRRTGVSPWTRPLGGLRAQLLVITSDNRIGFQGFKGVAGVQNLKTTAAALSLQALPGVRCGVGAGFLALSFIRRPGEKARFRGSTSSCVEVAISTRLQTTPKHDGMDEHECFPQRNRL